MHTPTLASPGKRLLMLAAFAGLWWTGSVPAAAQAPSEDFLAANMDRGVDPGKDFFQYANGGWLKRNPIPPSESSWGIGKVVQEQLYTKLRTMNETAAAAQHPAGSDQQKIGDFWASATDEAKAEQRGMQPLQAELDRIATVKTAQDALDVAFALHQIKVEALFAVGVYQDSRNSEVMALHLWQGGLGLPDRNFYVSKDKTVSAIRQKYVQHIARTLALLGRDGAAAAKVMAFETALARLSRKMEDLRDPVANYNKLTLLDLTGKHTPSIDWRARLAGWNIAPETVIAGQPEFLKGMDALLARTPAPVLQDYLRMRLVSAYAPYLSKAFSDEHFAFNNRDLNGQKEQKPRWKRALDAQQEAMGMVLGRIYVKEHFPEASKRRYSDMVEAIRAAYLERINALTWMSEETKVKARAKLASIAPKVGYPERWKDYSALSIGRDSWAANMMNAARWSFKDNLAKYGKPVDRSEWDMTPQTYNAYYNASNNEIVLPAAIFMITTLDDGQIDDAVAYGYTGASTIGHEITHGFDDEGRQFDARGNLTDWWSPADAAKFKQRADVMVKQFNGYMPLPGTHINGKASLGENIADHGGVLLGLDAFKKTAQYKEGKTIGGLTPVQRYFLGYALAWMNQQRDAALRRTLLSDVHAPSKWRVLGPLANIPEFYEAFGIKPGQPMYRPAAQRVNIW